MLSGLVSVFCGVCRVVGRRVFSFSFLPGARPPQRPWLRNVFGSQDLAEAIQELGTAPLDGWSLGGVGWTDGGGLYVGVVGGVGGVNVATRAKLAI